MNKDENTMNDSNKCPYKAENIKASKKDPKTDRIIIYAHGNTYDVTDFVEKHPIGSDSIVKKNGQDCTRDYDFHSNRAKKVWKQYCIKKASTCVIS